MGSVVWIGWSSCLAALGGRRLAVNPARRLRTAARRVMPLDSDERSRLLQERPEAEDDDQRRLRVAVLGVPNSGKSTLINALSGWNVCAVSSRAHTTRQSCRAVLTDANCQLLFEDTPGLVSAGEARRHQLSESLRRDPAAAARRADFICVLHDVTDKRTQHGISPKLQRVLFERPHVPVVLVLSKVDLLHHRRHLLEMSLRLTEGVVGGVQQERPRRSSALREAAGDEEQEQCGVKRFELQGVQLADGYLDTSPAAQLPDAEHQRLVLDGGAAELSEQQLAQLAERWRTWPRFEQVFFTSALEARGLDQLRDHLLRSALAGRWRYSPAVVTDQTPDQLVLDVVRSQLLEFLPARVPYETRCELLHWQRGATDVMAAEVLLRCHRPAHARLLVRRVRLIAQSAEQMLRDAFRCDLILKLRIHPDPKEVERQRSIR